MGEYADMAVEDVGLESELLWPLRRGEVPGLKCPDCGSRLRLKSGKFGSFYGCETFQETSCRGAVGALADGTPAGIPGDKETRKLRRLIMTELDKRNGKSAILVAMQEAGMRPGSFRGVGYFTAEECNRILACFGSVSVWDRLMREED